MSQFGESPPIPHASNAVVTISSQVMIAAVIFLFMVVIFIFFLYLYAKYYMGNSDRSLRRGRGRARTRFIFAPTDQIPPTGQAQGLDTDILKSLPIKSYTPSEFKDGLECAVCLSELSEGEKLRLIPKCNHGFHVDCIDMWFHSHATCPLCRAPVTVSVTTTQVANDDALNLNFPTNVLFWGNQGQVSNRLTTQTEEGASSSSVATRAKKPEGLLVIDIPRRGMEEFVSPMVSPLPTSKFASEEVVKTPKSARLRSFTKLLSRGKTVIASSTSSSPMGAADIEQGLGVGSSTSSLALKTPTGK